MSNEKTSAPLPCSFERAILSRKCGCKHAQRQRDETRLSVQCRFEDGYNDCLRVLSHMREGANFAFGSVHAPGALQNKQALRLQCGGLAGLQNALDKIAHHPRVDDVYGLIRRALRRYGTVHDFPRQEIVKGIASYRK